MSEDAQRTIAHQRLVIADLRKENASLADELEREVQVIVAALMPQNSRLSLLLVGVH